jgi:hypothetical protein
MPYVESIYTVFALVSMHSAQYDVIVCRQNFSLDCTKLKVDSHFVFQCLQDPEKCIHMDGLQVIFNF